MSESQTPRTDEAVQGMPNQNRLSPFVSARFARQLETELTATRARLAESEAAHAELTERYKRTHDLWIASEEEKGNLENEYESLKSRLAEAAGANKEMGDALEKICNMLGAVGPAQAIVEALDIWMENYDKMFAPCENGHGFQAECYGCQRDAALSRRAKLEGIAERLYRQIGSKENDDTVPAMLAYEAYKEEKK